MNLGLHVQDHPAAVLENRAKINAYLPSDVILPSQVHGNIVVDVASLSLEWRLMPLSVRSPESLRCS
jgi:copper oxidase (laccase) domain-containing protein